MYAHVNFGQIDPDQLDKYVETLSTLVVPVVKGRQGYQGDLLLVDPHSGKFIGIAFFQTEADRQAVEDNEYPKAEQSRTGSLFHITHSEPEFYEVRIADGDIGTVASPGKLSSGPQG
jgi:hypothetical protein